MSLIMDSAYESRTNQYLIDVQATLHSLGHLNNGVYVRDPQCSLALRDLQKFIMSDTDILSVRRMYLRSNIIKNDLVYLMKNSDGNHSDYPVSLRLVANITTVVEKVVSDHDVWVKDSLQTSLTESIRALLDQQLIRIISQRLKRIVATKPEMRSTSDSSELTHSLQLIVNILSNLDSVDIHDEFVKILFNCEFDVILLYACNSNINNEILNSYRIFNLLLKYQKPDELCKISLLRETNDKKSTNELIDILKEEEYTNKILISKSSCRFSQYSSSYILQNCPVLGNQDVITKRPDTSLCHIQFDKGAKHRTPKNKAAIKDFGVSFQTSSAEVKSLLKDFCEDFMQDVLMISANRMLSQIRRQNINEGDESFVFRIIAFFLSYVRHAMSNNKLSFISFCIQPDYFRLVYDNLGQLLDVCCVEKNLPKMVPQRLLAIVSVLKEMLAFVTSMISSENQELVKPGQIIGSNLVYVQEHREAIISLLRTFNQSKMPRTLLLQIIESVHHFLKLIDLMKESGRSITIQKVSVRRKKSCKKSKVITAQTEPNLWFKIENNLYDCIHGGEELPSGVEPFDSSLNLDMEEQKQLAFRKVKTFLNSKQSDFALAMLRKCRSVWTDDLLFGSDEMDANEEISCLRYIFDTYTCIPGVTNDVDSCSEYEDSDEDDMIVKESEESLDVNMFVMRFSQPKILQLYFSVLYDFKTNPAKINKAILKLLSRIAFDCKYPSFMFHLPFFRIAQKLLNDPVSNTTNFKPFKIFFLRIIDLLFLNGNREPLIYLEALFTKSMKLAYEMVEGYGKENDLISKRQSKSGWSEVEVNELKVLFSQACYLQSRRELDDDILTYITDRMRNGNKTRRQLTKKLIELGLIDSAKNIKRAKSKYSKRLNDILKESISGSTLSKAETIEKARSIMQVEAKRELTDRQVVMHIRKLGLIESEKDNKRKRLSEVNRKLSPSSLISANRLSDSFDLNENENHDNTELSKLEIHTSFEKSDLDCINCNDCSNVVGEANNDESDNEYIERDERHITHVISSSEDENDLEDLPYFKSFDEAIANGSINRDQFEWIISNLKKANHTGKSLPVIPVSDLESQLLSDKRNKQILLEIGLTPPSDQQGFWRINIDCETFDTLIDNLSKKLQHFF
ncbi:hypothetical protein GJ496_009283 [Pomphorhynchus laevis]|nr:hypothetical protein GJ496_009283 [Pomphorhynchus laevis]